MYICQICNKQPATVHLTDIHNNVKKELHMCEECAAKKGFSFKHSVSLPEVMSGIAKGGVQPRRATPGEKELTCDRCGMTWTEFRKHGRFGCANDYTAFRERLLPLIKDIHNHADGHVGKHPQGGSEQSIVRREIMDCRRLLREAIEKEAYEEAAKLRDQLHGLEHVLGVEN